MDIGVFVVIEDTDIESKFKKLSEQGFKYCQVCGWDMSLFTDEIAETINRCCEKYGVTISTFWCGWSGPQVWDFYEGPLTLGIVPIEYRATRMAELKQGSDFAKKLNVENVATHLGFIPENPNTNEYQSIVCAVRDLAVYFKNNGQYFLFETGQETPVTLLRLIEDVGTGNLGINLDPSNLIGYGKANPIDALTVFGKYVRDVHAKDGEYPTDGKNLGAEPPIGEGSVDFPRFIAKLKEIGYDKTLTIEREITGEQQQKDIMKAKKILESLI